MKPNYSLTSSLFFRCLGVIYLIAFLSLSVQITGLVGTNGILPVRDFLRVVYEAVGSTAWLHAPTLFWFGASDSILRSACYAGILSSLGLILGRSQRLAAAISFVLYLSLVVAGQAFLSFQWDYLLLETGFLAIFLTPVFARVWLFHWLLFRLVFLSGAVKLLNHDAAWRNLTALRFHYETQPLPTPLAWYFHQLPGWFQTFSAVAMFAIELAVPFCIFAPRRIRLMAAGAIAAFQLLIIATGNYAFFNLLTLVLCLLLCDDQALERWIPAWLKKDVASPAAPRFPQVARVATPLLFSLILLLSGLQLGEAFFGALPAPGRAILRWTSPFGIVNSYGLFAVMTTTRPEIVIEGSNDNQTWLEYEFRYKPGDVKRRPAWVEPHQPRLDWQMWFAALGNYQQNRWFVNLMLQLLRGSPDVLGLLGRNPFPGGPPRYIRARIYEYHFTSFKGNGGSWWSRTLGGEYFPPVSLRQ
ncbi:MAG: lipase maturation factor family protein [Candidatus Solibacter usitatus]|nr:lipase maturation factor family protein [Candidatus Solibacter usitatus]